MREVHLAIVEQDGTVSILKQPWAEPAQRAISSTANGGSARRRSATRADRRPPSAPTHARRCASSDVMSPLGIAARALFAYLTLLLLVRSSGKQSIRQGTTVQFVTAVVIGDMIDNLVWGEVSVAMFVVAVVVLFATHWTIEAIGHLADLRI